MQLIVSISSTHELHCSNSLNVIQPLQLHTVEEGNSPHPSHSRMKWNQLCMMAVGAVAGAAIVVTVQRQTARELAAVNDSANSNDSSSSSGCATATNAAAAAAAAAAEASDVLIVTGAADDLLSDSEHDAAEAGLQRSYGSLRRSSDVISEAELKQ
jgi:hypothetical protein